MATSHSSTSLMLGPSVSDSITDLEKQIQLINDAIGSALSSQQSSAQQYCPKCIEHSATLWGLQSHVQEAMKRLENHVQTLETSCQSTVNTQQSSSVGASQQIRGRKVSKKINGNNNLQQTNKASEQPTKSFREMLRERKNAGQASTTPNRTPTATETTAKEIKTLDDIIMSCAPYLTGSPTEYTSWLRNDLGVETISDLAKEVNERPGLLVAGNGIVGMWQKRKFSEAVLTAAATSVPSE